MGGRVGCWARQAGGKGVVGEEALGRGEGGEEEGGGGEGKERGRVGGGAGTGRTRCSRHRPVHCHHRTAPQGPVVHQVHEIQIVQRSPAGN
jgi:hypothetical protein